jgi:hypothetical protein
MVRDHSFAKPQNALLERYGKSPFTKGGFRGNVNMLAIVKAVKYFAFRLPSSEGNFPPQEDQVPLSQRGI